MSDGRLISLIEKRLVPKGRKIVFVVETLKVVVVCGERVRGRESET